MGSENAGMFRLANRKCEDGSDIWPTDQRRNQIGAECVECATTYLTNVESAVPGLDELDLQNPFGFVVGDLVGVGQSAAGTGEFGRLIL